MWSAYCKFGGLKVIQLCLDFILNINSAQMDHFKMGESQQCSMLENNNSGALDSQAEYAPIKIEHSNELNDEQEEEPAEKKQQPGIISSILNFFDTGRKP